MSSQYRCEGCGATFPEQRMCVDARDDRRCPQCGSLRILRGTSRGEKRRRFLLDYNQI